ncbi:hypothetical protein HHK36_010814 [Tetracentron sinense]|uniref:Uncharacterized protein n=1 Tax=Tetracentron sinense TaxID=13715 RepID=A0A834Z964_TETSI|nr:hypothetical protein HHK36_010814 [Tetracentron sinense]
MNKCKLPSEVAIVIAMVGACANWVFEILNLYLHDGAALTSGLAAGLSLMARNHEAECLLKKAIPLNSGSAMLAKVSAILLGLCYAIEKENARNPFLYRVIVCTEQGSALFSSTVILYTEQASPLLLHDCSKLAPSSPPRLQQMLMETWPKLEEVEGSPALVQGGVGTAMSLQKPPLAATELGGMRKGEEGLILAKGEVIEPYGRERLERERGFKYADTKINKYKLVSFVRLGAGNCNLQLLDFGIPKRNSVLNFD